MRHTLSVIHQILKTRFGKKCKSQLFLYEFNMLKYFDLNELNKIISFTCIFLPFVLWLLEKLKLLITCVILLNSAILEYLVQTGDKCEFT